MTGGLCHWHSNMRVPLIVGALTWVLLFILLVPGSDASNAIVLPSNRPANSTDASTLESAYQSEAKINSEFLMIPGSNLDSSNSSIPNRYECSDHQVTFQRNGLSVTMTIVTKFPFGPEPFCDVEFGDNSGKKNVIFDNNPSSSIDHAYPTYDIYVPKITCENGKDGKSKVVETCPSNSNFCTRDSELFEKLFKKKLTPFKVLFTRSFDLLATARINGDCSDPVYYWRITQIDGHKLIPFVDFSQPNLPILRIAESTMPPGFYIVELEITFPGRAGSWATENMFVNILLPELIATISGGTTLTVPKDETYIADATMSRDPVAFMSSLPSTGTWTLLCYPGTTYFEMEVDKYIVSFPQLPPPIGGTIFEIDKGTEFRLEFDSALASGFSWCFIYFSLSHDERLSTGLQVLNLMPTTLPISITCVVNCNPGRETKISDEQIQLDTNVTSFSDVSYTWTVYYWTTIKVFVDYTSSLTLESGRYTPSLGISEGQLKAPTIYKFKVTITDGISTGSAEYIRTVNFKPYNGDCLLDTYTGYATTTLLTLKCQDWQGTDERRIDDSKILTNDIDMNPMVTYTVFQRSNNSAIEEEPLIFSSYPKLFLVLKVGDPDNEYRSKVIVHVTDIYGDYGEAILNVTSRPAFDHLGVTANLSGANLVSSFMATDVVTSRDRINKFGIRDMLVVHTATVASHFYHINLPIWAPIVSENIHDSGGVVIDLDPARNSTNNTLGTLLDDAKNPSTDSATEAIRTAIENLTEYVVGIQRDDVINGNRSDDRNFISLITNCITNLVVKEYYVSGRTKITIINSGSELSTAALLPNNNDNNSNNVSNADAEGLEIEISASELAALYLSTVNAVVPSRLTDLTLLPNFVSGRYQLQDRIEVDTSNITLENATMSPEERTYLYYKMQKILEIEIDNSRDLARDAANATLRIARDIQTASKLCKTCSNENRPLTKQILVKNRADVMANRTISTNVGDVKLTGLNNVDENTSSPWNNSVSVSTVALVENVFMYDDNMHSSLISSGVLHVDVKSTTSDEFVPVENATFDQPVPSAIFSHVTPELDPDDASQFSIHKFLYRFSEDTICIKIIPTEPSVQMYKIYFHLSKAPTLIDYSFAKQVGGVDDWQLYVPSSDMAGHTGLVFLGVAIDNTLNDTSYMFSLVTVACMTWEGSHNSWTSDRCQLEWLPSDDKIRCHCIDMEQLTFANTFYAAPNSIDFNSVFLRFSPLNQAAVLGTLSLIFGVYVILVIWARRKDSADVFRWGTTPLVDNIYTDLYFYLITVHTGLRRGAGTRSRVGFRITGDKGDTEDRELSDGVRKELSRGSVNTFLMATGNHLGDLVHLAVWHDNTGSRGKTDWYVSQIVILDVLKDETYTFVCEKWLSLSTSLQMTALPNPKDRYIPIENRFYHQAKARLSEGHMWVSIAYRPVTSNFTRVQRASCAVSFLLLSMLANAVYFQPEDNYQTPAILEVGPFRFQFQQVYISFISALISTPAVLIIAIFFKRSKRPSCHIGGCGGNRTRSLNKAQTRIASLQQASMDLEKTLLSKGVLEYEGFYLPSVCYYLAWLLVVGSFAASAFFVVLFSIEWGKQKSEEWLTAFMLSLFESLLIVDPAMVCLFAVAMAIVFRSTGQLQEKQDHVALVLTYRKMLRNQPTYDRDPPPRPVQDEDMEIIIRRHKNQLYLLTALKNILVNLFFMWIIFSIGYSNRDDRSFLFHNDIANRLVSPNIKTLPKFEKIQTPNNVYRWLNETVFPQLYPEEDVNGESLHWSSKEYINGFNAYRLGPTRLRQLRTTKGKCTLPLMETVPCYSEYTISTEDTSNSCIGWAKKPPCSKVEQAYNFSADAWLFQSALDIWGLPVLGRYTTYGGGGYIAELGINRNVSVQTLNELYNMLWLDRQTRAVMLEFTLFCANANLFVYNMFIVEFPETGGAFTSYNIFPIRLYLHEGVNGVYTLVCEVIFLVYLLFLLFKICLTFYQERREYFHQVWHVYELVQFGVGVAAVVIYFIRFALTFATMTKFQTDPKIFVNFYHVVFCDHLLVTLIGVLVFMATLRTLQVFGTSKRVRILVSVFNECGSDLLWFGVTFAYMWISFSILAYLLFGGHLVDYNSLYRSMATLFTTALGSSRFREMNESDPILAKVFFMIFIVVIVLYTLTIFLSILCGSIDSMTADMRQDKTEDLMDFFFDKIKQIFRLYKPSVIQPVPVNETEPAQSQPVDALFLPTLACYGDFLAFELFWETGLEMDFEAYDRISNAFQRALMRRWDPSQPIFIDMSPSNMAAFF